MESFCPLQIDLNDRECLVIGGGIVAGRKVKTMLSYRAKVTVLSPHLSTELSGLLKEDKIFYQADIYRPVYLKNSFLVICATDSVAVNRRAAKDCIERGILVNTVSDPGMCTFFLPALYRKGPLTLTVSTAGKSPALASRLRDELAGNLEQSYADFADFLGHARALILEKVQDQARRRELLEHLAGEDFFNEYKSLPDKQVWQRLEELLQSEKNQERN